MFENEKAENACVARVFLGGNLKASLLKGLRRVAFTMAGGGQAAPIFGLMARRIAFTMAEILLSLTIIGVVAAITLPSLTGNINERTWNTQRKALYSRMAQAVNLLPSLRGYGQLTQVSSAYYSSDNATEAFLTAGLSKVLKLNNICSASNFADCGLPTIINTIGGASKIDLNSYNQLIQYYSLANEAKCGLSVAINVRAAAFETANGESVFAFYNPVCEPDYGKDWLSPLSALCANFIYDLNGKKGPNTMGKDVGFMSVLFANDPIVVAPTPVGKASSAITLSAANQYCRNIEDARVPNREELISIAFNYNLMEQNFGNDGPSFWSTSKYINSNSNYNGRNWVGGSMDGGSNRAVGVCANSSATLRARCVKR